VVSHFGRSGGIAAVTWRVLHDEGHERILAEGAVESSGPIAAGEVREVATVGFAAPPVLKPAALRLEATVSIGGEVATNEWPMWTFPDPLSPAHVPGLTAIIDPAGHLDDLRGMLGDAAAALEPARVAVASRWTDEARDFVEAGGGLVLLQPNRDGPLEVEALPYWREAIRVAEPHPAWADFPTEPFLGLQLAAAAADHAFVSSGSDQQRPIMRRLDARTGQVHDYALELRRGRGRMIATTLRLAGGVGDLPRGLSRSPGALHLLMGWLRYLSG
jgi:hypothetical protein